MKLTSTMALSQDYTNTSREYSGFVTLSSTRTAF